MVEKLKDIKNHFWKDVLIALLKLKNNIKETQESVKKALCFTAIILPLLEQKYFIKTDIVKGSDL